MNRIHGYQYNKGKPIGSGTFSEVFRAEHEKSG
jgi:serine/threonine protein kinase